MILTTFFFFDNVLILTTILNQRFSIHVGTSEQKQDRLNNRIKRGELLTIHFLMPVQQGHGFW